jgi:hypothetical protein
MAYTSRVLVVARQTAASDDLLDALRHRAERGPIAVTLLMPAPSIGFSGREEGQADLDAAVARLHEAGLEGEGICGDHDPIEAVAEIWQPGRFDEVIVATLPGQTSRWMRMDLPHRIGRMCDVPVMHVIARAPGGDEHPTGPPPKHEREPLGPLAVLTWTHPQREG